MSRHDDWIPVSPERPCPICGKPDWCAVSRNGDVAVCGRTSEGSFKETAGGFIHELHPNRQVQWQGHAAESPRRNERKVRPGFFGEVADANRRRAIEWLPELADQLGVSDSALKRLGTGYCPSRNDPHWTFPERDGTGQIIGIMRRNRYAKSLSGSCWPTCGTIFTILKAGRRFLAKLRSLALVR